MPVREQRLYSCTHMWAWLKQEHGYSCRHCLLLTVKAICHNMHAHTGQHPSPILLSIHNYNHTLIMAWTKTFLNPFTHVCILEVVL